MAFRGKMQRHRFTDALWGEEISRFSAERMSRPNPAGIMRFRLLPFAESFLQFEMSFRRLLGESCGLAEMERTRRRDGLEKPPYRYRTVILIQPIQTENV